VKPGAKQVIPPREPLEIKAQRRTSEHQPVTQEIAGSNPVAPARSSALDLHRPRDPHVSRPSQIICQSLWSPGAPPYAPSSPRRNWTEIVPRLNLRVWSITASAHLRKRWLFRTIHSAYPHAYQHRDPTLQAEYRRYIKAIAEWQVDVIRRFRAGLEKSRIIELPRGQPLCVHL